MLKITLINPTLSKPYPHVCVGDREVYAIEAWQPITISVTWNLRIDRVVSMVELLLAFDGRDALADVEEYEDAPPIALSSSGIVLDQPVFVRGAKWFEAEGRMRRDGPDLTGTVWAALFLPSDKASANFEILPARVGTGVSPTVAWTRSSNPKHRLVTRVEYDTHANLLERGIVIPLVNQHDVPETLVTASRERKPTAGLRNC